MPRPITGEFLRGGGGMETSWDTGGGGRSAAAAFQATDKRTDKQMDIAVALSPACGGGLISVASFSGL